MTDIFIASITEGRGDKSEGNGCMIARNVWKNYVTFEKLRNLVITA